MNSTKVDFALPAADIGRKLVALVQEPSPESTEPLGSPLVPKPTLLTCPECHGPLELLQDGYVRELRCRVGHTYAPATLQDAHEGTIERTLWAAVLALEQGIEISHLLDNKRPGESKRREARRQMALKLREMINSLDETASSPEDS